MDELNEKGREKKRDQDLMWEAHSYHCIDMFHWMNRTLELPPFYAAPISWMAKSLTCGVESGSLYP